MSLWAEVTKGMGVACPARWGGAGSWLESRAGAWTGREHSENLPGEISDCSLILHFIPKVHLCSVCAGGFWKASFTKLEAVVS